MTKTIIKIIIAVVVLALIGLGIWYVVAPKNEERGIQPAKIEDIRKMAEMSAVEIYEEVPLRGRVGSRHLVAMQKLEGRISFDLEKIELEEKGDTIYITLPSPQITLRESTKPDSYVVIDEWNEKTFGRGSMTTAQVNELKRQNIEVIKRSLQRRGFTVRAQQQADANIRRLYGMVTERPVVVRFK